MKLSLIISTIFAAAFVQAVEYVTLFNSASAAEQCVTIDGSYLKKVSDFYRVEGPVIFLANNRTYSPAIEQNIREVCGKNGEVVKQTHT
ncbi:hypothetical protein K501DRAFT_282644 [Backusella circina FSU 941]|nr:hypothetical protein K501DRAFT_282644 [Backusella circina FSU 941]